MAKGPLITDTTRQRIVEVYFEHPDWRAKEVQAEVNQRLNGRGPGLSAVQKELTKIRKKEIELSPDPEDGPWHVVTLADYDMPAEALPVVLLLWGKTQQWPVKPLTIREAKWVARLYRVVTNIEFLYIYAHHYARQEKIARITGALPPSNIFWGDANMALPAMESLLFLIPGPARLPDFEMMAASIYERPPKGTGEAAEEAVERLRLEIAVAAKKAGLSKIILDELIESVKKDIRKEAQNERSHTSKGQ